MERYFGGEEFSVPEILMALTADADDGTIVPVTLRLQHPAERNCEPSG